MHRIIIALAAAAALSGCASKASSIAPSYVSPIAYQGLSCGQIAEEARVVSARAVTASAAQDNKAGKDAAVTAVGAVIFWPALFFIDGDGAQAAQVAQLKGEMQALEGASRRKGCGIQFQAM